MARIGTGSQEPTKNQECANQVRSSEQPRVGRVANSALATKRTSSREEGAEHSGGDRTAKMASSGQEGAEWPGEHAWKALNSRGRGLSG